ncbi:hypothetical protein J32TS6_01580 [Virgibacillus pantothenticus]|uniref:hypothetical protein n=1 Tax=Virgibacillus pantothenticus TaxID=1473 RepID=UPI001B22B972|nr:hypothetical protein [Virgibacillus pantothenticus]MBU8565563.1 hypothetical protein [Virgibacillus pantothenticus]MBU8599861.1 hypothetical protein [Virgibacillus pantothenticus]MBU8634308.1 hypothetical protein [Virgibacillus pantothenticus]MBU8641604.1 hypothetical protein [Virgibacillus pantothenticus]MBU8647854.1 hypothetical protein [Virgibacillus pantothenticus]
MEELFEAIFGNAFIIFAVIAGIIGFFKDSFSSDKEEKSKHSKPTNRPVPPFGGETVKKPSNPMKRQERARDSFSTASASEQKQQQMEQLAEQIGTNLQAPLKEFQQQAKSIQNKRDDETKHLHKQKLKRQVANNLTQEGLVNGIIMAEVLGKPRAKNPYRSILSNQMKRKQIY